MTPSIAKIDFASPVLGGAFFYSMEIIVGIGQSTVDN